MDPDKHKNRLILKAVWLLLPFPLVNLLIPVLVFFLFLYGLPALYHVYFNADVVSTFPSPIQIEAYGIEFYQSLLLEVCRYALLSILLWSTSLVVLMLTLRQSDAGSISSARQIGRALLMTALSISSALLGIFALSRLAPV